MTMWLSIESAPQGTAVWVYDPEIAKTDIGMQKISSVPWPIGCRPAVFYPDIDAWVLMGVGGNLERHPTLWCPLPNSPEQS